MLTSSICLNYCCARGPHRINSPAGILRWETFQWWSPATGRAVKSSGIAARMTLPGS